MRRMVVFLLLVPLAGCSSSPKAMPDLIGKRLDIARSDLKELGLEDGESIEVVGGGTFGALDESNWTVCDQEPKAKGEIGENVRVLIDRTCGSEDSFDAVATPAPTASATPEATVISPLPSGAASPTPSEAASPEPPRAVPKVAGLDLQTAQDTLQAAGFFNLRSHDASGRGRLQVFDRDWTVVDQTPSPGTISPTDQLIDLGAKKLGE